MKVTPQQFKMFDVLGSMVLLRPGDGVYEPSDRNKALPPSPRYVIAVVVEYIHETGLATLVTPHQNHVFYNVKYDKELSCGKTWCFKTDLEVQIPQEAVAINS